MSGRLIQGGASLAIRRVEETVHGHVIAVTEDDVILTFATAAELRELIDSLAPALALLEAREATQMAGAAS